MDGSARASDDAAVVDIPAYVVDLERARRLARLLDTAITIPGTNIRFGLDAQLGLVPGVGDALGTLLSSQIVVAAARSGVPQRILMLMLLNLVVDTLVVAIPLLGDSFDIGFRANQRNYALLERHHGTEPGPNRARHRLVLASAAIVTIAVVLSALGV